MLFVAAGCMHAASAQSNVTIYGVVDAGITRENNGVNAVTRMDSGMAAGSRLGFKGQEDLGNGMSAIFTLENGFGTDTGSLGQGGRLFGRQAWVGLSGALGTVKLGRQRTFFDAYADTFDPFDNALAGDTQRLFNYYDNRTDNTVSYAYEAKNGVRGEVQYGVGEVPGNSKGRRTIAALAGYRYEALDVMLVHHRANDPTGADHTQTTLLGGNYNLGYVRPYVSYAWNKGPAGLDTRDALIGARVAVAPSGTFLASVIHKSDKARSNADTTQWAVGYLYDLSKRTALYTSYAQIHNDDAASYQVARAGAKNKMFDIGIRHRF